MIIRAKVNPNFTFQKILKRTKGSSEAVNEKLYPAHKREFLGLKWAVTDKFHDYLYGNKFELRTDNNPLTYVLGKAKLDATSQRWIAALASYEFSLTYMCGKSNTVADSLSRLDRDHQELFSDAVKAICDAILVAPSCPSAERAY